MVRRLIFTCKQSLQACGIRDVALLFLNSQPLIGAILPKTKACTFIYILSLCMWAVKVQAIFRGRAGSSEPSLLAYATGTIIS